MSKNTQTIILLAFALVAMAILAALAWRILAADPDSVQKMVEDSVR
ncbi:MAG TPA: hypothetical protein VFL81_00265 [Candidatus Saccharimonadales bacterium]|nr:hypothetical protein [Candidatus Saccharimonadales bacterium]